MSKRKMARVEIAVAVDSDEDAERFRGLALAAKMRVLEQFAQGFRASMDLNAENIERFIYWGEKKKRWKKRTPKDKRQRLLSFVDYFGSRPLDLITDHDMMMWYDHMESKPGKKRRYVTDIETLSPDTIRKYLNDLKQFVWWARNVERAVLTELPCEQFTFSIEGKLKSNQYPPQILFEYEYSRNIKRLHSKYPHVATVVRGVFLLGARPEQLFSRKWDHIKLPTKTHPGRLDLPSCKGGVESTVVIEYGSRKHKLFLDCLAIFKKFRKRKPKKTDSIFITRLGRTDSGGWTSQSYADRLSECCRKVQVKDFVVYIARHTGATLLQGDPEANLATVQSTLQHRNVNTQEVYGHRTSKDAAVGHRVLEKFEPDLPAI